MKYKLIILAAMAISVMFHAVRTTREALPTGGTEDMGAYYVAQGEPRTFHDPQTGNIEVVSAAGNQYTADGNQLTVVCKKGGRITYHSDQREIQRKFPLDKTSYISASPFFEKTGSENLEFESEFLKLSPFLRLCRV